MAESMDDYKKELEESYKSLESGDVMSGKVENEEQAELTLAWQHLTELRDSKQDITVKIAGMVNGGLIATVEGIRGFIPASQLALEYVDNLDEWLGKSLKVRVITVEPNRKKLVLSAKVILKEAEKKARDEKFAKISTGMVFDGKVESLQAYGAFVDLGDGINGLLHISQISDKRLKHPGEVLKEGETVKVKVIKIEDGKISLSMKALNDVTEQEEEVFDLPETQAVTTSLGDLLKGIKL